jgi:hypothetical protein
VSEGSSAQAHSLAQSHAAPSGTGSVPHFVRLDFAYSTRTVFYVMAGIIAVAAVVAKVGLRPGVQAVAAPSPEESHPPQDSTRTP